MNISLIVYPCICHRTFGLLLPFGYWEESFHEHVCTTSVQDPVFSLGVNIPRSGIAETHGSSMFNFWRDSHTFFHISSFSHITHSHTATASFHLFTSTMLIL